MKIDLQNAKINGSQIGNNNKMINETERTVGNWDEALNVLKKSMDQSDKTYDLKGVEINGSQIGDNNAMMNVTKESVDEWSELLNILKKNLNQLNKESNEYKLVEQVQQCAKKKDKKGLKNLLENKNNMIMFAQNVLGGVVSAGVYDLLKNL